MRICFFGTYTLAEGYPVNRTILNALGAAGATVIQCRGNLWNQPRERWAGWGWLRSPLFWYHAVSEYIKLIIQYFKMPPSDIIVVGYLGHQDVFLLRLLNLFRKTPVVLVAFNSLYETLVKDRKLFSRLWPTKVLLRLIDRWSCQLADRVILDTQAHIDYFVQEFGLPPSKFIRVFVGSNLSQQAHTRPEPVSTQEFKVVFVGTYIPLHGIETILRAAALLKGDSEIKWLLLGQGQILNDMKQLAQDLGIHPEFVERWISGPELNQHLSTANICLGIFGEGEKTQNVIPCKVFDYLALGKPMITANTPAARELLRHEENALLIPTGDPQALAEAITHLKRDTDLRKQIGENAASTYQEYCGPSRVGEALLTEFRSVLPKQSSKHSKLGGQR